MVIRLKSYIPKRDTTSIKIPCDPVNGMNGHVHVTTVHVDEVEHSYTYSSTLLINYASCLHQSISCIVLSSHQLQAMLCYVMSSHVIYHTYPP